MNNTSTQQPNNEGRYYAIALILGIIILLISSCSIEKRLARKQAKWCNNLEKVDSVITIQNDTIIQEKTRIVKLAPDPDTLLFFAQAYCDSFNQVQLPTISFRDGQHQAEIQIIDNQLRAEIICNMDSLQQIITEKNTLIKHLKEHKQTKYIFRYKTIGKFYQWFFWIIVIVFVVGVAAWITWRHYSSKLNLAAQIIQKGKYF